MRSTSSIWELLRRGSVFGRRPPRARRCSVCGTAVRADDALGLLRGTQVHAECALAEWLYGPATQDRAQAGAVFERLYDWILV